MSTAKKIPSKKGPFQSVKGMRDISGTDFYSIQGFIEKAQEISEYYGFKPFETPILEETEVFTTAIGEGTDVVDKEMYTLKTKGGDNLALRPEHTAGTMRAYIENGMNSLPQPVLMYHYGPVFRHDTPQKGRYRQFTQFDLDAFGSEKSIIDALLIRTAYTILQESGAKNLSVDINSIGDKDCRSKILKELTAYYKKHQKQLPAIDQQRLLKNPLRILDSKDLKTIEINEGAPSIIECLCNDCKKHFKEVTKYLDEMSIPYTVNNLLVRGLSYYTRTVFEIMEEIPNEDGTTRKLTITGGGRYDGLAKQLGSKKEIPAVGISFGVDRVITAPWWNGLKPRIINEPRGYFIQFGIEAKLKALNVLEIMRTAKFPVSQTIAKDKLGEQLARAEKMGAKYVFILGQREALDNTVIVKNMENRHQDTVKITDLANYLKKLK